MSAGQHRDVRSVTFDEPPTGSGPWPPGQRLDRPRRRPLGTWPIPSLKTVREALNRGAKNQEGTVEQLQRPQHQWRSRCQAEGAKERNSAPHRSKGRCTGQEFTLFAGMETRQQVCPVDRAGDGSSGGEVQPVNSTANVQLAHQSDFSAAERAVAIVPDNQVSHASELVRLGPLSPTSRSRGKGAASLAATRRRRGLPRPSPGA